MLTQFSSLIELFDAFPDEQSALDHFRSIRWKRGAFCPYCKSARVMHFKDGKTHKCSDCRQRFSIKVGTIFEDTKLPMRKWFAAIWLLTNHKKGIASTQLAEDLKITQKSAWFVLHRLRYASRTKSFARPLAGDVEADESYFGGRVSNKHLSKRKEAKGQYGPVGKTVVFGVLERGDVSEVRAKSIPNTTVATVQSAVRESVAPGSRLMTDQATAYTGMPEFEHHSVNHRVEYVRDGVFHTNSIEGFWSLAKRQYHGTHHWISDKHMNAYLDEMCYRWNRRDMTASERVNELLAQVEGRLTYEALTA